MNKIFNSGFFISFYALYIRFFLSSIYFTASFRMYNIVNFSWSYKKTRVILRLKTKRPFSVGRKIDHFRQKTAKLWCSEDVGACCGFFKDVER
jgi:hypothetical protein